MDKKKFKEEHTEFIERFCSVVETKETKFWMRELEAQYNLIWGWKKKTFPSLEYAIRVCELSGVSANWLFFGVGPQYLEDSKNSNYNDYEKKESLNLKLISMFNDSEAQQIEYESKISQLKAKIHELEMEIKKSEAVKFFHDLFQNKSQNKTVKESEAIETLISPLFSFLGENSNEIFELINKNINTKNGKNFLQKTIKWIKTRRSHGK